MESNLTLSSIAALFGTMFILAITPSASVLTVVTRSITSGFSHGCLIALGMVIGDFIFILFAVYGLSSIAETMDSLFILVKYLGSAYLIWLGLQLWRAKINTIEIDKIKESSWFASLACGLSLTLGDPRAIFFYISFLPAFINLSHISLVEIAIIMIVATIAVGGAKMIYAYMADRSRFLFQSYKARKWMNIMAGSVMMGTGIFLVAKN